MLNASAFASLFGRSGDTDRRVRRNSSEAIRRRQLGTERLEPRAMLTGPVSGAFTVTLDLGFPNNQRVVCEAIEYCDDWAGPSGSSLLAHADPTGNSVDGTLESIPATDASFITLGTVGDPDFTGEPDRFDFWRKFGGQNPDATQNPAPIGPSIGGVIPSITPPTMSPSGGYSIPVSPDPISPFPSQWPNTDTDHWSDPVWRDGDTIYPVPKVKNLFEVFLNSDPWQESNEPITDWEQIISDGLPPVH